MPLQVILVQLCHLVRVANGANSQHYKKMYSKIHGTVAHCHKSNEMIVSKLLKVTIRDSDY